MSASPGNFEPIPADNRSLRDKILSSRLPSELVYIEEWGGEVLVIGMTGAQRDEIDRMAMNAKGAAGMQNLRSIIARMCVHDPQTRQALFTREDEGLIGELSGSALDSVLECAQRLSGIGADAVDREKKV